MNSGDDTRRRDTGIRRVSFFKRRAEQYTGSETVCHVTRLALAPSLCVLIRDRRRFAGTETKVRLMAYTLADDRPKRRLRKSRPGYCAASDPITENRYGRRTSYPKRSLGRLFAFAVRLPVTFKQPCAKSDVVFREKRERWKGERVINGE